MGACYGRIAGRSRSGQNRPTGGESRTQRDPGVKTQPLKKDVVKWKSETPITMGQLNSKRDEFWETAPMFEGRKEIWDAIKGAVVAVESSDFGMAQAILDGANIYIPHGTLIEAYDELGNQYKVPIYCLSRPLNLLCEDFDENSVVDEPVPDENHEEESHLIKLRLSSTGKDVDLQVRRNETVSSCKVKLGMKITTGLRQRWFYGGKLLEDKTKVKDLGVPDGHIIQVVFLDHASTLAALDNALRVIPVDESTVGSRPRAAQSIGWNFLYLVMDLLLVIGYFYLLYMASNYDWLLEYFCK